MNKVSLEEAYTLMLHESQEEKAYNIFQTISVYSYYLVRLLYSA